MRFAEQALERNEADYVHMVRAFHADPEILTKSRKGEFDDICMCNACNKCIDLMFGDQRVRCALNPSAGREREMALKPAEKKKSVMVVGGGLAGSEAAWQLARAGVPVVVHEMRPERGTDAHRTGGLAELVCSNSFRSDDAETNAVGLLHEEMRRAGSLIMAAADKHRVPAGSALAVDRDGFSAEVGRALEAEPRIGIERREVRGLPPGDWGLRHRRHRAVDVAGPGRGGGGTERRGEPGLFRRHRAHRHQGQHRFHQGLVSVPLRQGR